MSRTLTTMNKSALARELHLTHCTYSMFALKIGDEALDKVGNQLIIMTKFIEAKPIIVKLTMVKLFILFKLFMAQLAIIAKYGQKNDGKINYG